MRKAVSILLIAVLVTACAACGQNQMDGSVTDSTGESVSESSSQGADVDTRESEPSEEPQVETEGGGGTNPVLSENQASRDASADMESSSTMEYQQETARESTPLPAETDLETSTMESISMPDDRKDMPGNDGMYMVNITVGNEVFASKFYDNESARVLMEQMPMTLDMQDFAGQEKVLALDYDFPAATIQTPPTIHTGDIYLYSGNRLVLFYTTFTNSYSYVPIGYIEDTAGLAAALGDGNALVTFSTP